MTDQGGEDDANVLSFGGEFVNVSCLSNAEVKAVLDNQKRVYEEKNIPVTPAFVKTMRYVTRFGSAGGNVEVGATTQLREALQQFETHHGGEVFKLHQFEIMQLANLMQADSEGEEVLALIPSMGERLTEDDIERILQIVRKQPHSRLYS